MTEPVCDRREQRDREPEHHRVQVGEEDRLQVPLPLEEPEPVLDGLPAHLVLVGGRR
jgi:hypothetical protein